MPIEDSSAGRDVKVHTYASPGAGSVNTHWVESPTGIVVIDAQRLISQARAALGEMQTTGKPVEAVIITHAHPDHIGGVRAFADAFPSAPIFASPATIESIRLDEGGLLALGKYWLGDDFEVVTPNRVLEDQETLTLAGLTFETSQVGPGEASAMDVVYLPDTGDLFAADVVFNGMTPFLAERRTGLWLDQIERLAKAFSDARRIYPGHGEPAAPGVLIHGAREYLARIRALVADYQRESAELTPEIRGAIVSEMERSYPGYLPVAAIPDVIGLNVEGVWLEMRQKVS